MPTSASWAWRMLTGKTPVLLLGAAAPTLLWFSETFASTLQGMCEDDPDPISYKEAAKA